MEVTEDGLTPEQVVGLGKKILEFSRDIMNLEGKYNDILGMIEKLKLPEQIEEKFFVDGDDPFEIGMVEMLEPPSIDFAKAEQYAYLFSKIKEFMNKYYTFATYLDACSELFHDLHLRTFEFYPDSDQDDDYDVKRFWASALNEYLREAGVAIKHPKDGSDCILLAIADRSGKGRYTLESRWDKKRLGWFKSFKEIFQFRLRSSRESGLPGWWGLDIDTWFRRKEQEWVEAIAAKKKQKS